MKNKYESNLSNPTFSIIILCWNSNQFLRDCLASLDQQTYKNFEIILIDNSSPDPVPAEIIDFFSDLPIHLFRMDKNLGYASGNNYGATKANGDYLVLLNSDAFPKSDWLTNIKKAITKYPDCFFSSKLIKADDPSKIDGAGDVYHFSGLVWRNLHNRSIEKLNFSEKEVFSPCGAAAIFPKIIFMEVGGFDDDFFAYVEDIDLGFRLRLAGYKCIFLPEATVYHVGSGSTNKRSDFSVYYGQRNLVWTFMKNVPFLLLIFLLPFHFIANFFLIIISFFRNQGKITFMAKVDAIKELPQIFKKRKLIQRNRKIKLINLLSILDWNPLSPIQKFFH